jgi:hypothetical protein
MRCGGRGGYRGGVINPQWSRDMRSIVLWALGVPLGVIVLLNLFNVI